MIKITIAFLVTLALLGGYFFSLEEDKRWLLLNEDDATNYAEALLKKDMSYKPKDKFIDYIVSSENGYVMFSEGHNSRFIYGYFPDKQQAINHRKLDWTEVDGNWFVAKIKLVKK